MTVHGLMYGGLLARQQAELQAKFTEAIASAIGVEKTWLRDEKGKPGQVSLGPIQTGTVAGFVLDVPPGMSENDVSRALLEPSFISTVKSRTAEVLGPGQAAPGRLEVRSWIA